MGGLRRPIYTHMRLTYSETDAIALIASNHNVPPSMVVLERSPFDRRDLPQPPRDCAIDLRELADALRDNRKLEAIKRFRTLTGCGLKDAKDVIDAFFLGVGV
jgi:hypothetical protein